MAVRECGMCGQIIPPKSKMAQRLTGATHADVLRQMPTLSSESTVPVKEDPETGGVYLEVCMACWIETGEANRR
jgi:hypothetical protein